MQVSTQVVYDDYSKYALGPTVWDVTMTSRTIEVSDNQLLEGKGSIFGHKGILMQNKKKFKCNYKVVSMHAEVYEINVKEYMDLASDRELRALLDHNQTTRHSLPGEHLEHCKAIVLARIFIESATEANKLRE